MSKEKNHGGIKDHPAGLLFPAKDYVSPGFRTIKPDHAFPNMVVGNTDDCQWPYLRREIPHNWYVDRRIPTIGFLSRDEAHILYNTALKFAGRRALEIGCWLGWSACHMALAGLQLDVIDPLLSRVEIHQSVFQSLSTAGAKMETPGEVTLVPGTSPEKVAELASRFQRRWSLIFIDGDHDAPGPLKDAMICERYVEPDAIILFHDLASPDVGQGLDYLKQLGWETMIYQTMQVMGVAWRGQVEPVIHAPDPQVSWQLPDHLSRHPVSNGSTTLGDAREMEEFNHLLSIVRPYTLLSQSRLWSLFTLAKQVCRTDLPGNFVECGTCKGGSAAVLAYVIKHYSRRPRILFAFDTFEGMPEPTVVDQHRGIPANETGCGAGTLKAPVSENLEVVCGYLGVTDIVRPVPGLFADTLPIYTPEIGPVALLHADGDWYESTMDIFNHLYGSVVENGIVQIDDYGHWEGCRKAVHDVERNHGTSFSLNQIDYTGVWFQKK